MAEDDKQKQYLRKKYATVAWKLEQMIPDWIRNVETMQKAIDPEGKYEHNLSAVQIMAYKSVQGFMERVKNEYDERNKGV